jgi:hypothetical protein
LQNNPTPKVCKKNTPSFGFRNHFEAYFLWFRLTDFALARLLTDVEKPAFGTGFMILTTARWWNRVEVGDPYLSSHHYFSLPAITSSLKGGTMAAPRATQIRSAIWKRFEVSHKMTSTPSTLAA